MSTGTIRKLRAAGVVTTMVTGLLGGVAVAPSSASSWECDRAEWEYRGNGDYIKVPHEWEPMMHHAECFVHKGARGDQVAAIQRALVKCYGQSITVDGVFGDKTFAALKNAQRAAGVTADGAYGPKTRDAIKWPLYHEPTAKYKGCTRR
ncbi:peptidoglycan-binding domain-containing protein [Streptomyces sp. SID7909]|uniref:peptidoglycan-binding domain-containing protein n=1 Tax=Streptomyces sp. SID7909 TaxID=2706092 RepID=UPI0013BDFB12|nr:peptidoglycan-binding domain-containing protein [Streptomyces sp. SID7909]NEC07491.1 peptidoglycan-binding protein [Streptomyces sp. SID7909]